MAVETLLERWPYAFTVLLLLIGLHGMLVKQNLLKKLIGMNIFQGAIILFFIVYGYKTGATVPVLDAAFGTDPTHYDNPIPHGLMLTAIVVSVATTGVGLALLIRIYRRFGTIDEAELLARLRERGRGRR
jgi:multicomponent Na+:H+ antiporter subunit C